MRDVDGPPPAAMSDRAARYGWRLLILGVGLAIVGSVFSAATWEPGAVARPLEECVNPPCLGLDGGPQLRDLPVVVPMILYGVAILLGIPSAVRGAWSLVRGKSAGAGQLLLPFIGPLLVLVGTEIIPHVLSPCLITESGICEVTSEGTDVRDRWHAVDHTLVGTVPMTAGYWLALRRWRSDLLRRGR
jgi:hypothetical protein